MLWITMKTPWMALTGNSNARFLGATFFVHPLFFGRIFRGQNDFDIFSYSQNYQIFVQFPAVDYSGISRFQLQTTASILYIDCHESAMLSVKAILRLQADPNLEFTISIFLCLLPRLTENYLYNHIRHEQLVPLSIELQHHFWKMLMFFSYSRESLQNKNNFVNMKKSKVFNPKIWALSREDP